MHQACMGLFLLRLIKETKMLQVKNPYDLEIELGKSCVLFNYRPLYLEDLRDYEPPIVWTQNKYFGGETNELSGLRSGQSFEEVRRDFIVALDAKDLRRLKSTCKSASNKIEKCLAPESFMQLFAHGSTAQNLIIEFSKNSDKVDLSLDLMFAQLVRERISDNLVIGRLSPCGSFPEDKLDHLAKYLVSGFNIHDYWKNYYRMKHSQETMENARQSYIATFSTGE